MNTNKASLPRVISTRQILHPAVAFSGPRITSIETIQMFDGSLVEVDFWTNEAGRIVKLGDPRKVSMTPATPNYETTEIAFLCK